PAADIGACLLGHRASYIARRLYRSGEGWEFPANLQVDAAPGHSALIAGRSEPGAERSPDGSCAEIGCRTVLIRGGWLGLARTWRCFGKGQSVAGLNRASG